MRSGEVVKSFAPKTYHSFLTISMQLELFTRCSLIFPDASSELCTSLTSVEVNQLLVAGVLCAPICRPIFRNRFLELQHWVEVGGAISGKLTRQQNMQILRDTEIRRWLASIVSCWSISLWIWPVLTFLIAHVEIHLRQPSTQLLQNAAMHPCSEIFCLKWIVKQSWQSKGNPPKLPPLNLLWG